MEFCSGSVSLFHKRRHATTAAFRSTSGTIILNSAHVCMYVCMYVCPYVCACMYERTSVRVYACSFVCIVYVSMHAYSHVR